MVQQQYWNELFQFKSHINFIELQLEKSEWRDRTLKVILAIASSSSIGGWVLWKQIPWLWTGIIVLSQIISAISPYLPFKSRIKSYSSLLRELEEIMIQAELKWHAISEGELTSSEINAARFKIRSMKQKSLHKYIHTTIPTDKNMQEKAEKSARIYFENFYIGESYA